MLDREHVMRAVLAQADGVLSLGMHLAGGNDGAGQAPDQRHELAEHRDLVGLGSIDGQLREHGPGITQCRQQHRRFEALAHAGGALRGLAVHVDAPQQVTVPFPAQRRGPGTQRQIQLIAVRALQRAGDRGGIRGPHAPVGADPAAERGQQLRRGTGRPFPDRGQLAVPGHHRRHRDRQQVRQVMPPAPPVTRISHPRQETQQPRASGVIQPRGPAQLTTAGVRGQHRLRRAPRRRAPRRPPGERAGQLSRRTGRQPRRDLPRQPGRRIRGQAGRQHSRNQQPRCRRHHHGQHLRHDSRRH
jgi:hypothetical protein